MLEVASRGGNTPLPFSSFPFFVSPFLFKFTQQ